MRSSLSTSCAWLNIAAGGLLLLLILPTLLAGFGGADDVFIYLFAGALLLAVGVFLLRRMHILVTLFALPLMLFSVLVALFLAAGGWIWGPAYALAVDLIIGVTIVLALLQLMSVTAAWRDRPRTPAGAGAPSPGAPPSDGVPGPRS